MLRYFLRVDPGYGAAQVAASLRTRKDTGCYKFLLQGLGDELPKAQQSAIDALDDPVAEVARGAAQAPGHWGTADAEAALWPRFHEEWAGREDELRSNPRDVRGGISGSGPI